MTDPTLFDRLPRSRKSDPATSRAAEATLSSAATACGRLLAEYRAALPGGLTDEEAAERAGIDPLREGGKRCADLRRMGLVRWDGATVRAGSSGRKRMVCTATGKSGAGTL